MMHIDESHRSRVPFPLLVCCAEMSLDGVVVRLAEDAYRGGSHRSGHKVCDQTLICRLGGPLGAVVIQLAEVAFRRSHDCSAAAGRLGCTSMFSTSSSVVRRPLGVDDAQLAHAAFRVVPPPVVHKRCVGPESQWSLTAQASSRCICAWEAAHDRNAVQAPAERMSGC